MSVKFTVGDLTRYAVSHAVQRNLDASQQGKRTARPKIFGNECAPIMEASNGSSPCGMWQLAHMGIVRLGPAGVIEAGREVEVVVAGTTSCRARFGRVVIGLCGAGRLAVANRATESSGKPVIGSRCRGGKHDGGIIRA